MTFDYTATAARVQTLLARFGTSVTHTVVTQGAYDPDTGAATPTETTQTLTVAVFDYPASFVDGTHIRQGDRQAYASAVGVTAPKAGDTLELSGADWSVVSCKPLQPALTAVLYELQVRGA